MTLTSKYVDSHALVIGINVYRNASPLRYAVSDANAVAEILRSDFSFPQQNIHLLIDEAATRATILDQYLSFACGGTDPNDRLVVFFAGHGHTVRSSRGEVGFLVPFDADMSNLASLIRWDELTRDADFIDAKHILFLMDACYGGLAITRALKPGSMRFLRDMLLRPARQALAAGKADELVADVGGPVPDHSVFTGHLLQGMTGFAADKNGLITGNGLMTYVYQKVGSDPESRQTPHFGYLSGDGDFIFRSSILEELSSEDSRKDEDILVTVPAALASGGTAEEMGKVEAAKEFLAEDRFRIKLHDLVAQEIREVLSRTAGDHFAISGTWSLEEFKGRLDGYEAICKDLVSIQALLGFWAEPAHRAVLTLAPKQISARLKSESGLVVWVALRWYPSMLLLYAGGISAIAAGRYDNLHELMLAPVSDIDQSPKGGRSLICAVGRAVQDLGHDNAFKDLPGHERQFTPRSEYLHKSLQPLLDELLFLGSDYESSFDRFEVLFALEHAHRSSTVWGPIGRFGWKFSRGGGNSPFHLILSEADAAGASWPPLKAGLFGGSLDRFREVSSDYREYVSQLHWR